MLQASEAEVQVSNLATNKQHAQHAQHKQHKHNIQEQLKPVKRTSKSRERAMHQCECFTKTSNFTRQCRRMSKTKQCVLHCEDKKHARKHSSKNSSKNSKRTGKKAKGSLRHSREQLRDIQDHAHKKLRVSFASTVAEQAEAYLQQDRANNIVFVVETSASLKTNCNPDELQALTPTRDLAAFAYTRYKVGNDIKNSRVSSEQTRTLQPHQPYQPYQPQQNQQPPQTPQTPQTPHTVRLHLRGPMHAIDVDGSSLQEALRGRSSIIVLEEESTNVFKTSKTSKTSTRYIACNTNKGLVDKLRVNHVTVANS